MRNSLFWGVAAAALIAPACATAQETTSTIRGSVTSGGAAVAGAEVTVVHVPSGTRSTTATDANGSFTAQGLRPGGPYTVSVSSPGYTDTQVTDIATSIGQPYNLTIELPSEAAPTDLVITASRLPSARTVSQGPATVLNANQISRIASVNRDIRDLMRRDPFATLDTSSTNGRNVSFAGQNSRFNRFTIDGVPINDSFGLNQDGLPSRRGPVPLDAIGQFQTKVAPYDVREGFFQGGVINAVLRSGTNRFQGTGFYTRQDDSLTGDRTRPYISNPTGRVDLGKFKSEDFGAELSGPIIKDKLFFMIAGERVRANNPINFGTTEDNAGTPVVGLDNATLQRVLAAYNTLYSGRDPGGILRTNQDQDDRLVGKLDANLSDTQRLSVTGIYTEDSLAVPSTTGNASLGLASNAYIKPNRIWATIAQLNSTWSDTFSTEARVLYRDYKSGQNPLLGLSSSFSVCAADTSDRTASGATTTSLSLSCPTGVPQVVIGPGGPSQSNILRVKTFGASGVARLSLNDHNLRIIAEYQDARNFNQFVNNNAGTYYFDSLADLAAGNAQQLTYQNAPSLDPVDAAASFRYQTYTFGVQDDWRISDILTVSYGARFDLFGGHSTPVLNTNFLNRYGFPNTQYINGLSLFQPRFGFDFAPTDRLTLRGGAGIFGGGTPDVYVGNSFSQSGVQSSTVIARITDGGVYQINGSSAGTNAATAQTILTGVNINQVNVAAQNIIAASDPTVAQTTSVNALDPDFKVPSQWRATLSADYRANFGALGDGWRFGVDGLFSGVRNQVLVTDIRSVAITGTGATTPDGRQRYAGLLGNSDTNADYILTNTRKGRSWVGVVRFDKAWDFGLGIAGSYTYQNVKDQAPLTSSQAGSLYGNVASADANSAAYGTANDEVRHSFKYNLSFDRAFFGTYRTRLDLFGETRIGSPFSYTFQDASGGRSAVFGVTQSTNTSCNAPSSQCRYLFYVPEVNDPLVVYDSDATRDRVEQIIGNTGLGKYRGQVAPRNAFNSKWFTKIDLHVEQEVPALFGSRISLFADIENFTNLLNSKWGQQLRSFFAYNKSVVRVACVASGTNPCAQYRYSAPSTDAQLADQLVTVNGSSLYAIRLGARFSF